MPTCLVAGVREARRRVQGPVIFIANLLTEGRGMRTFTAGRRRSRIAEAIGRPVDVRHRQHRLPYADVLARYAAEHKHPLPLGTSPADRGGGGRFLAGDIARHGRRRLLDAPCGPALWGIGCYRRGKSKMEEGIEIGIRD